MPPGASRSAFRWAEPLDRAARVFAAFIVGAGVLGALARPFVGPDYAFPAGLALAYTLLASVDAWRTGPDGWRRWWRPVILVWVICLGVVWAPRHLPRIIPAGHPPAPELGR